MQAKLDQMKVYYIAYKRFDGDFDYIAGPMSLSSAIDHEGYKSNHNGYRIVSTIIDVDVEL